MYQRFIMVVCIITAIISCSTSAKVQTEGLEPYKAESPLLYDSIARMDSILFDAYNTCKSEVFASLVSDDIEFYHDRGGLSTSKPGLVEAIKQNICGKVNRELLKGSIEVYPIPGYGAVEMGAHRFHNKVENSRSRYAKFVHIWHRQSDGWKLARVVSLH